MHKRWILRCFSLFTAWLACVEVYSAPLANFQNEVWVGSGLTFPTAMEFLPDGRLLISEFSGKVLIVQAGATAVDPAPVLQLVNTIDENVVAGGERGLINVIADPNFDANGFIYLFYTAGSPQRDRVSRFTMSGNAASLASEVVIWQGAADSTHTDHHGGGLVFGPDGKLYITTGDNGDPPSSQPLTSDHGKVLRVNSDGTVPTDNPFYDGTGPNIDAIWARGLRNPWRISLDVPTGRIYTGDVGFNTTEEINVVMRGANYGWPICEGSCGNAGMTNPIFTYPHGGHDSAVVGGFVYREAQFPASYHGVYFYGDYAQNRIRYLTLDAAGNVTGNFNFEPADGSMDIEAVGDPVMLRPGPDGALYYLDVGLSWERAQHPPALRRIVYSTGNQPPITVVSATPLTGPAPLTVAFSSAGSYDPEGDPLTYAWTFGDGATSTQANPNHTYTQEGVHVAQLTASDSLHSTPSDLVSIAAGNAPAGLITEPTDGSTFRAGDEIVFSGTATDLEDGALPSSAFSWNVWFHHDSHLHPLLGPLNGVRSGTFNVPALGHSFEDETSYEIRLTVTDSDGLPHVSSVFVYPEKSTLSFDASPSGLTLVVDGINRTTPFAISELIGFQMALSALDQTLGPDQYDFASWSDGQAQTHTITVPESGGSYTATFIRLLPPSGLVAAYSCDAGVGTALQDLSGNGNQGTLSGATWTTQGRHGGALVFDGANDLVTVPDAPSLDLTTGLTLEAWVYPTVNKGVRDVLIKEGSNVDIYNLYARNWRGLPEGNVRVGGNNRTVEGSKLPINTWTHLATTYDGAVVRLFVNGVQSAATTVAGSVTVSTGALRLGGNNLWGEYFQGRIDEVRIYSRALSVTEIQSDMNTPLGGPPPNTPPTISAIADRLIEVNTSTPALAFTVGDGETAAGSLTVNGTSSDPALVATGGIVFGGSGANRTVTVTPQTDQTGTATITLTVSDGALSTSTAFVLTVILANTPPTLSDLGDQSISEDNSTGPIAFTVGDAQTAAGSLSLSGSSSNPVLVPSGGMNFVGNGANRTVTVTPAANQHGSATITVTVSDGQLNASDVFGLTVSPVNDPPTLSAIADQTTAKNTPTVALPLTVGDVETVPGSLTLSGTSSNPTLVSPGGIVFGGSGANRTVTVSPQSGQTGTATISVTVSDGDLSALVSFTLTVNDTPSGLVAAYSCDAGVGTALQDLSGNGNQGTLSGATWTTQGRHGGALVFDGANDLVTVPDAPSLDLTTGLTLEGWVYPTVNNGVRDVLIKEGSNVDIYNLYARNWRGRPEGNVRVGSSNRTAEGSNLPINTWTHLATTYDGAVVRLFVNGVQSAATTVAGSVTVSTGALRLGGNNLWGEYFQGRIDEVRIYNRALTSAEIQSDMNSPLGAAAAPTALGLPPINDTLLRPRLSVEQLSDGTIRLRVAGPVDQELTLEWSEDLIQWHPAGAQPNKYGSTQFAAPVPVANKSRFYRVIALSPTGPHR